MSGPESSSKQTGCFSRHPNPEETWMSERKFTHTQPGRFEKQDEETEDGVVNDSLGTIDTSDSTGVDEELETGDAKADNLDTKED
jgi:hypothetical protein